MIWFSSDLHFGHELVAEMRGFDSLAGMNAKILVNIIAAVQPEDDFYILGDIMLGVEPGKEEDPSIIEMLRQIPGHVHVIRGNHDTDRRVKIYESLGWEVLDAKWIKYRGWRLFLTHFPAKIADERNIERPHMMALCGHVHTSDRFHDFELGDYHVEVDAHDLKPVSADEVIDDIKEYFARRDA